MAKMRVVQVPQPKVPFELAEREVPEPSAGSVRIKVQTCGICQGDSYTKDGLVPSVKYPRAPGHEVVGIVDAVGANVRDGPRDNGSASAGMAAIAAIATRAGAATPSPARPKAWSPASRPTADMPIT
jgi:D-arabinose 1-dehydrogenase-like Zn-dependent alcohol dehydrogenase